MHEQVEVYKFYPVFHIILVLYIGLNSSCAWCRGRVPARCAAGRVAAEMLCPYPPGVPAVVPGEVLTEAILAHLAGVLAQGGKVTGAADESLRSITVVAAPGALRGSPDL